MILVDTNIISEVSKPAPNAQVLEWLDTQHPHSLYTSTITKAEVLYGLVQLPPGKRRDQITASFDDIMRLFFGRILNFDERSAEHYANISFSRKQAGQPIQIADAMIAAIAKQHQMELATRNTKDFEGLGLSIINPFEYKK